MSRKELQNIRNLRTGKTRKTVAWIFIVIGLFSFLPLVAGIWLLVATNRQVKLWDSYDAVINPRGNTSLEYISSSVKKSINEVIVEVNQMIENGFFLGPEGDIEAIIDTKRAMLVMCRDGKQIEPFRHKEEEEGRRYDIYDYVERSSEAKEKSKPVRKTADVIDDALTKVEDEEVRLTLERLSASISRIEEHIDEEPALEQMKDIKKLRAFYLPQTIELIDKMVKGRGTPETIDKIEETLKLCANAFETIEEHIMTVDDIETVGDIAVLANMFEREGLLDSDFDV